MTIELDREVALKLLPSAEFADEHARARLLREARAAAGLNHPNICTIHEVGEAGGQPYIAMEFVPGEPLSALLARGHLPLDSTLRYGRQLADALDHAHQGGIVHRDLKSGNIVITPNGRAKILDFGVAKRLLSDERAQTVTQSPLELTQAGSIVGTLPYMAPEQLRGQPADARSDIWALGVVIYEMAAGERPFTGQTSFEVTSAILDQPPREPGAAVPSGLVAVIERCLRKEPQRRYQRAGEVRAALDVLTQTGSRSTVATLARRRRWLAPAALAVALAAAGVLWWRGGWNSPVPAPRIEALAVLPLANLSGDQGQDYFADGMTEALITDLSKIRELKVISRTSSRALSGYMQGASGDRPGTQRRRHHRRVRAAIGRSGPHHGAADRGRHGSPLVGRQLRAPPARRARTAAGRGAGDCRRKIRARVTNQEPQRLARVRAVDPRAHEAYLRGRAEANRFSEPGLRRAIEFYEQALRIDAKYAPAHAGLASAYALLGGVLAFYVTDPGLPQSARRRGESATARQHAGGGACRPRDCPPEVRLAVGRRRAGVSQGIRAEPESRRGAPGIRYVSRGRSAL